MNQIKIGSFIKELRKEKGLTQEQLAEQLNVSRRTVSRWETGDNLPDLDILIEMADYYDIDLRELLDGERKSEKMNKELEETVLKVAEYSNEEKNKLTRKMNVLFGVGIIAFSVYLILVYAGIADTYAEGKLAAIMLGLSYGIMTVGVLFTSGWLIKIKHLKKRILMR